MKRLFIILAVAGTIVACNNSADSAAEAKDSIDSLTTERKEAIDSTADQKKEALDSLNEQKKDAIDRVDSLNAEKK